MEAWKQSVQAIKVATGQTTESQRQGWTVAAALIWHLRRKRRAATDARTAPAGRAIHGAAQADGAGQGVVVFDVETTQLIDDGLALEDMEVSVATAMWLPAARNAHDALHGAARQTFWHRAVERGPDGGAASAVGDMLKWFDDARMIVAYNGREFDMRVLWRHYDGDEDRWRRHMGKLHDPMTTVTRAAGRRIKLP